MKKIVFIFIQSIALGLGIGLCLAGLVGLLYRALHSSVVSTTSVNVYFWVAGGLMGSIGGWCLGLQRVLALLLSSLFMHVAELVPAPAARVGEEWAKKMEAFFGEVLKPFPGFFRKIVEFFLVARFEDYGRINRALDKAKQTTPETSVTPQWLSLVVLHYFLEPLWIFFYAAYAILFVISCVFWSLPFFK